MGAVASLVEDAVGGVVEAAGDLVEGVVDVVKDVGSAIDDYVIQPILDDPLTAIATVGAATFLGPAAAAAFGTSGAVGVGIAAGAANTAAGLVQGEDFGEAIKGGLTAGVMAGGISSLTGGAGGEASPQPDALDTFLAENNNFADVNVAPPVETAPGATITTPEVAPTVEAPVSAVEPVTAPTPEPLPTQTASPTPAVEVPPTPSPLQTLNTAAPEVSMPTFSAPSLDNGFTPDYNLTSGMKSDIGLQAPKFTPSDSFNIYGEPNYSVVPNGMSGGPGLQPPGAPSIPGMGGGTGLTADFQGLPQYMENGVPTTFTGENGQIYGNATPDYTIGAKGITTTPTPITYGSENMGTMGAWDKALSGDLTGAAKTAGGDLLNWAKENPWTAAGTALGATTLLGGAGGPPAGATPNKGGTKDANFTKPLDLYEFMRDKVNYQGDLSKYGQGGQGGEHQFFQNTRFVPVPIPGQAPTGAKLGGLIQMKHFAQGGQAQAPQMDPRRAQMMQAMAQQHPAGQGMPQGRPPMPQGGMMPGRPMVPGNSQGLPTQAAQQQRPMPQRPRDPKTAYYQYGTPPVQAKAMGGLSSVHSMRIGGGADGRSDDVPAVLSDGEYVMDAETVAMLGNGSSKAGAAKLDQMRSKLRQHKGQALAHGKISPNAKSPLAYLKGA